MIEKENPEGSAEPSIGRLLRFDRTGSLRLAAGSATKREVFANAADRSFSIKAAARL